MKLSYKIGLGFGVLIIAAYILGGTNVWIMQTVIKDSSMLTNAYVPYVLINNKTERFSMSIAYAIRGYIFSEDKTYLNDANENLVKVKESLKQTKELADRSPYFKELEQRVGKIEAKVFEYEHLINEIISRNETIRKNRELLENSALEYTTHCIEFLQEQNEAMKKQIASEFISAYESALIEVRFKKIALMFEVIELSNSIHIANSRFQSVHDSQIIQNALNTFNTMNNKLKELMAIALKDKEAKNNDLKDTTFEDKEIKEIEHIANIANIYQESVINLLSNWLAMQELKKQCENTTDIFLHEAVAMSESGMAETKKVSQETQSSLISAVSIIVIGFIIWGIGSVLLATFTTITYITKPINRLVQLVRKVAEGDLSESSDTVQLDLNRKDEIGIMTSDMVRMTNRIRDVLKEINYLIHSVEQGMLEIRGNEQIFSGAWQALVIGVNNVVNSFMIPFKVTALHIERISIGDIPEKITTEYKGDFNKIKNNLNLLVEATAETTRIAEEIAGGNLTAVVKERSKHDRMMFALKQMVKRLNEIMNETKGMIQSVKQGRLDIHSNAEAFDGGWRELVIGVNELIFGLSSVVSEKTALKKEMELARRIQTCLLPEKPEISGYEITASCEPSAEVGGDYYDVISVAGYDWVIIGDVSGHGVTAGLVMMMVQTAIYTVLLENPVVSPSALLIAINKTIYNNIEKMNESKHMTIIVLAVEKEGLFAFSGLHENILIWRSSTGKVDSIETDGMWIGVDSDISNMLVTQALKLETGDCMVLYTDGITESRGQDRKMFGEDRLINIIESAGNQSAHQIHADILNSLKSYEKRDDVTLFVMKRV